MNKGIEIFKIVQRIVMVILTIFMLIAMFRLGDIIVDMKKELVQVHQAINGLKEMLDKSWIF